MKVGTHRGNKRVWIEGKNLIEAGFLPGKQYATTITEDSIVLNVIRSPIEGIKTRKVSNKKGTHPIIDMNSKAIITFFGDNEQCIVSFGNDLIIIMKGE